MRPLLKKFDVSITNVVSSLPDSLQSFFLFITSLGDPIVTLGIGSVVAAIGIIQANLPLALAGTAVWLVLITGALLKLLFGRARPVSEYSAKLRMDTFSFPSGHSSGAMIAYGLLAYVAFGVVPQPWGYTAVAIGATFIFLIGTSRIYLEAHFPSDVVAGWALGGLGIIIIVYGFKPLIGQ